MRYALGLVIASALLAGCESKDASAFMLPPVVRKELSGKDGHVSLQVRIDNGKTDYCEVVWEDDVTYSPAYSAGQ
ncbi:MAG TPA: hypothetical protein VJB06_00970, partial [archaeon]|nr:hypothetical protein [archaeon]